MFLRTGIGFVFNDQYVFDIAYGLEPHKTIIEEDVLLNATMDDSPFIWRANRWCEILRFISKTFVSKYVFVF